MKRSALVSIVLSSFLATGCMQATWRKVTPATALRSDSAVLVGSVTSTPPLQQHGLPREDRGQWVNGRYEPPGKIVFTGETDGNVMAIFTRDLSETWNEDAHFPLARYEWAYLPIDGSFFIEVPRSHTLYLRGITYLTNAGPVRYPVTAKVEVGANDRVVYVGNLHLVRTGDVIPYRPGWPAHPKLRALEVRNRLGDAKAQARKAGLDAVAKASWALRLMTRMAGGVK